MKTDWIAGLLGPWSAELAPGSILLRLALSMALAAHHRLRTFEQAALGRSSHVHSR